MRVFVTGASGAIGRRLVPQLIDAGHEVIGTHNAPASAAVLRTLGAKPVLVDLLDATAVREAVLEHEVQAIVHEATAFAHVKFSRNLDRALAETNELRTTGTDALLAAAREAGVRRIVAQSGAVFGRYARRGGPVKTEEDPIGDPPANMRQSFAAFDHLERVVTEFGGTSRTPPRRPFSRWSTRGPAIYNIVDDDPAPVREWLPLLARTLGAKPPRRIPTWLGRLLAGEAVVVWSAEARGASNAKAKRELGWAPRHPSWRQGFPATYSKITVAGRHPERLAA